MLLMSRSIYGKILPHMPGKSTEILGRLKHDQETIPRRILILATSYAPLVGGAELAIQHLTDRLPDFSFDLITSLPESDLPRAERIGNVNVFRVGGSLGQSTLFLPKAFLPLAIFFRARKLLSENSYDLIYVLQASQAGGAAWLLKTFSKIRVPIALNLQDGKDLARQNLLIRWSRKLILGASDYFIVISNYLADFLKAQGIPSDKIFLIPNGTEANLVTQSQDLRNLLRIGDAAVIMTVSRLVKKNGVSDLLEAFAQLQKDYSTKPLKLVIIGNGELEGRLKSQTKQLGINSDVIYTGTIAPEKIPEYLSLADIFVRPSLSEGLGIAFLEAMAAGLPIIATPVGGIPDFLKNGETGLFCKVRDPKDLSEKMLKLLNDDLLRQKLSRQGKELVLANYTWDIVAQKFREVCEKIIGRHQS